MLKDGTRVDSMASNWSHLSIEVQVNGPARSSVSEESWFQSALSSEVALVRFGSPLPWWTRGRTTLFLLPGRGIGILLWNKWPVPAPKLSEGEDPGAKAGLIACSIRFCFRNKSQATCVLFLNDLQIEHFSLMCSSHKEHRVWGPYRDHHLMWLVVFKIWWVHHIKLNPT